MRLLLHCSLKINEFPLDYRRCIISFLKKSLTELHKGKYYEDYYKDTKVKPFCFNVGFPNPEFKKDVIKLSENKINIYFSAVEDIKKDFVLSQALLNMKGKKFCLPDNNFMVLNEVIPLKEKSIEDDRIIFKTSGGSSIIVKEHEKNNKDKYYTVEDNNYKEKLQEILKNQCEIYGFLKEEIDTICINNVIGKKIITKHYGIFIDSTFGMIDISANKNILKYFYEAGLGSKHSAGYGMVDIV